MNGQLAAWLAGTEPGELVIPDIDRKHTGSVTQMSREELHKSFSFIGTVEGVECYRHKQTSKIIYIGRTTSLESPLGRERRKLTPQELAEHDRAFQEASRLTNNRILWVKQPRMPRPGWWTRRQLRRALSLLTRVQELNPEHWSAMWGIGKIHERLGDYSAAFSWFERAYRVDPYEVEVVKSACESALQMGRHDEGLFFASRAIEVKHGDFGLHANLALAFLLAGRVAEAKQAIDHAVACDPSDRISVGVQRLIRHFTTSGEKPPTTLNALDDYRRDRLPVLAGFGK